MSRLPATRPKYPTLDPIREADLRLAAVERLVCHALVAEDPEFTLDELGDYLVTMVGAARTFLGGCVVIHADDWFENNTSDTERARYRLLRGTPMSPAERAAAIVAGLIDADRRPHLEARSPHQPLPRVERVDDVGLDGVRLVRASTIRMEQVDYLQHPLIPLRVTTLMVGLDGVGKSTVLYSMAADATRGQLDGIFHGTPVDVVVAVERDHPASVIVPRLSAAVGGTWTVSTSSRFPATASTATFRYRTISTSWPGRSATCRPAC